MNVNPVLMGCSPEWCAKFISRTSNIPSCVNSSLFSSFFFKKNNFPKTQTLQSASLWTSPREAGCTKLGHLMMMMTAASVESLRASSSIGLINRVVEKKKKRGCVLFCHSPWERLQKKKDTLYLSNGVRRVKRVNTVSPLCSSSQQWGSFRREGGR